MDINDYRTNYTRQEFIGEIIQGSSEKIQTRENCPSCWGLTDHNCKKYNSCEHCWSDSVIDIQFKGEEDEIIEESKDDYKWIFKLEEYKQQNIAIKCHTPKVFDKLFDILITNGVNLDKEDYNYAYSDYEKDVCFDYDTNDLYELGFSSEEYYIDEKFRIIDFEHIDFSQVWDKESIEQASLNTTDKNIEEFDITKLKSITLNELLSKRGFKSGDIIGDESYYGIIYADRITYLNTGCVDPLIPKAFNRIIPVELIESNREILSAISLSINLTDSTMLDDYFIKIEEEPQLKTICSIKFTSETNTTKDFILELDDNIEIGEIIECCTGSAYQYGRIVDIAQKELKDHEINTYRKCRKLSN